MHYSCEAISLNQHQCTLTASGFLLEGLKLRPPWKPSQPRPQEPVSAPTQKLRRKGGEVLRASLIHGRQIRARSKGRVENYGANHIHN